MKTSDKALEHWAIYIDIEGFSPNYDASHGRVIAGLENLMESIYWIGSKFCSKRSRRLCAFQAGGDGFFIDSEYGSPHIPIAIAIILMRSALLAGTLTKAGISEGECIGISGWRPEVIRQNARHDRVRIGSGYMHLFPIMGTAYISAYKITNPKGALLLIDSKMAKRTSVRSITVSNNPDCNVIDWIHTDIPEIQQIAEIAEISIGKACDLEESLKVEADKAASTFLSEKWLHNTLMFNNCA